MDFCKYIILFTIIQTKQNSWIRRKLKKDKKLLTLFTRMFCMPHASLITYNLHCHMMCVCLYRL